MRTLILLFALPVCLWATSVKEPVLHEMQQIALATRLLLRDVPQLAQGPSKELVASLVSEHPKGVYLRFDPERVSAGRLLDREGKPYLVFIAEKTICIVAADRSGNYNGKDAKHFVVDRDP